MGFGSYSDSDGLSSIRTQSLFECGFYMRKYGTHMLIELSKLYDSKNLCALVLQVFCLLLKETVEGNILAIIKGIRLYVTYNKMGYTTEQQQQKNQLTN